MWVPEGEIVDVPVGLEKDPSDGEMTDDYILAVRIYNDPRQKACGKKYASTCVRKNHHVFKNAPSKHTDKLGIPLVFWRYPPQHKHIPGRASQVPNDDAAYLQPNNDGSLVIKWKENTCSVLVARADGKDLEWQQVAALCYYCRFGEQEMKNFFKNLHPLDPSVIFEADFWTQEMFAAFFELFRLRMKAVHEWSGRDISVR